MTGTDLSKHEPTAPVVEAAEDPSGLVRLAIERGVDVEVLERLVGLQERVSDRNASMAFIEAVSAFRAECPAPTKSRENTQFTVTRNGVKRPSMYAPLEEIAAVAGPVASTHGLVWTWDTKLDGEFMHVTCKLLHVGGHFETATVSMPYESKAGASPQQKFGSTQTYGMRYSLIAVLGLTMADEDVDGAGAGGDPTPISTEQWAELEALVQEVGADRVRFLDWLKVDDLKALPEHRLQQAIDALERKRDTP